MIVCQDVYWCIVSPLVLPNIPVVPPKSTLPGHRKLILPTFFKLIMYMVFSTFASREPLSYPLKDRNFTHPVFLTELALLFLIFR